jgi:hypothetical protein
MIIKAVNPPLNQEKSLLRVAAPVGTSVLYPENASVFNENSIQIEATGTEIAEIIATSVVYTGSTRMIVLNGTTSFAHGTNAPVYDQQWNRVRFYKASAVSATYNLEITSAITPDKLWTEIDFPSGVSTDYGKVAPYDSVGALEGTKGPAFALSGFTRTTAKKIIEQAKKLAGVTDSKIWDDALVEMTTKFRMKTQHTSTTYAGDGSTTSFTLPSNFLEEDVLDINSTKYAFVPLRDYHTESDNSLHATIDGTTLYVGDTPSSSDTLTLYYYSLHPAIANNSEDVNVAKYSILALKYFMCAHFNLAREEGTQAERFFALYRDAITLINDSNPQTLPTQFDFIGNRKQYIDRTWNVD